MRRLNPSFFQCYRISPQKPEFNLHNIWLDMQSGCPVWPSSDRMPSFPWLSNPTVTPSRTGTMALTLWIHLGEICHNRSVNPGLFSALISANCGLGASTTAWTLSGNGCRPSLSMWYPRPFGVAPVFHCIKNCYYYLSSYVPSLSHPRSHTPLQLCHFLASESSS